MFDMNLFKYLSTHYFNLYFIRFLVRAHGGGEDGSIYLQALAKYLQEDFMKRPLDRILKMVRQLMIKKVQVVKF